MKLPTIRDVENNFIAWQKNKSDYYRRIAEVTCDEYFVKEDCTLDEVHVTVANSFGYVVKYNQFGFTITHNGDTLLF